MLRWASIVRGLGTGQTERLEAALREGPFEDILAFAQRTADQRDGEPGVSGAFDPWYRSRREAMWALRALDEREARGELGKLMDVHEPDATFAHVSPKLQTAFDLWSTGLTPGPQAIAHLRPALQKQNVLPASHLADAPNHLVCKVGGMVITRQRPGTAKGFVFLTLEDDPGSSARTSTQVVASVLGMWGRGAEAAEGLHRPIAKPSILDDQPDRRRQGALPLNRVRRNKPQWRGGAGASSRLIVAYALVRAANAAVLSPIAGSESGRAVPLRRGFAVATLSARQHGGT